MPFTVVRKMALMAKNVTKSKEELISIETMAICLS
jgi:hypothetical protein